MLEDSSLQGTKSYVSVLNEICAKQNYKTDFNLIDTVENGKFECQLKVSTHAVTAIGWGKKRARQNAAAEMLEVLKNKEMKCAINSPIENSTNGKHERAAKINGNPVHQLHKFFHTRSWPLPIFHVCEEGECGEEVFELGSGGGGGGAGVKRFVCSITSAKSPTRVVKGHGSSRRSAKRNASAALLKLLSEDGEKWWVEDKKQEKNFTMAELEDTLNQLNTTIPILPPPKSPLLTKFYSDLKSKLGKTLASILSMSLHDEATNFCQLLQEVAEEQLFEVVYKEYVHKNRKGEYQCSVHFCSDLVQFLGTGPTPSQAHKKAAWTALLHLRTVTRMW